MILGTRATRGAQFTGMNVFLLRDWVLPVDSLGIGCFKAFDEALSKMRADSEATRIVPIGFPTMAAAAELNTASEAVLRNLPERHRTGLDFYTLAVARGPEGRQVLTNLPAWATIHVEKSNGNVERVERSKSVKGGWMAFPVAEDDSHLHLALFTADFEPRLETIDEPRFRRLSRAVEEAGRHARFAPSLSVELQTPSEI